MALIEIEKTLGSNQVKIIRYYNSSAIYFNLGAKLKSITLPDDFTGILEIRDLNTLKPLQTEYWVNGKLHREDGPAVVFHDTGLKEWFLNDVCVTAEEVFERLDPKQQEQEIWKLNEWR